MLYGLGEDIVLIGEIFPAVIDVPEGTGYPAELPGQLDQKSGLRVAQTGILLKVFITGRGLLIGWSEGQDVQTVEIPLTEDELSGADYQGGLAGPYRIRATGICKCRDKRLAGWDIKDIYPGSMIQNEQRRNQALERTRTRSGLIPPRGATTYSRA